MDIKNPTLAQAGHDKVAWALQAMPALRTIAERFEREQPFKALRISACLHVTAETAALVQTLRAGGGHVRLCASNPLSTQDDVAAALATVDQVEVFAIAGEDATTYRRHLVSALEHQPHLLMDDGADLTSLAHTDQVELSRNVLGGTEETTTGVTRLRSMAADGVLRFPMIAVNDAATKHLFDNRHGTGQSTIDGILRATNRLLAGCCFVVCGYGPCGRGLALRAKGMGARVVVTEVHPTRALEAAMDGLRVLTMSEAAKTGDVFCTVTGNKHVIRPEHFAAMKDGAIVSNAGHFDVELDLVGLEATTLAKRSVRPSMEEHRLENGRRVYVLAQGRLVNLSAAEGHPADVMDLSFANQALSAQYLATDGQKLAAGVHRVPERLDQAVARLKLDALGIRIDTPTPAQDRYVSSWRDGT